MTIVSSVSGFILILPLLNVTAVIDVSAKDSTIANGKPT
jgi:hypothetical protein